MKTLLATSEAFIKTEATVLNADASAGSSVSLTVLNNDKIANDDYIVIGIEGSEQAEITRVNAVVTAGVTVQVVSLTRPHKKGEPIVKYRYNQRKFYGATIIDGTYTELTAYGSPANIQVDDPQGALIEYTGTTYSYFKATYYNSTTLDESDIADAVAFTANDVRRYCTIDAIRTQAGITKNPYITDGRVEVNRKRAENEVNSYLISRYQLPLLNSAGANEVPWMVENLTTLLAAGYIDYQERRADGDGVKWLGEARAILKAIQNGSQSLLGIDNQEMTAIEGLSGVMSYPDQIDNTNGPQQVFGMMQKF